MNYKEELNKELENISPLLKKMKEQKEGMQVPENYFHNVQVDFFNSLKADKEVIKPAFVKRKNWLDTIAQIFQPKTALAFASVFVLVFAAWFVFNQPKNATEAIALEDIPMEDLELFLEENIEDFSTEMLVTGNEKILEDNLEENEIYEEYYDELIEESDLNDLL